MTKGREFQVCSEEKQGLSTMLFSPEGGDTEGSVIRRRAQRSRRDINTDQFSQVLRGSASDDLKAETNSFVFVLWGASAVVLRRSLQCSVLRDLRMSLAADLCTCWSGLVSVCGQPASSEVQQSDLNRMHELASVLVASSVRYWRMELVCLLSMSSRQRCGRQTHKQPDSSILYYCMGSGV